MTNSDARHFNIRILPASNYQVWFNILHINIQSKEIVSHQLSSHFKMDKRRMECQLVLLDTKDILCIHTTILKQTIQDGNRFSCCIYHKLCRPRLHKAVIEVNINDEFTGITNFEKNLNNLPLLPPYRHQGSPATVDTHQMHSFAVHFASVAPGSGWQSYFIVQVLHAGQLAL